MDNDGVFVLLRVTVDNVPYRLHCQRYVLNGRLALIVQRVDNNLQRVGLLSDNIPNETCPRYGFYCIESEDEAWREAILRSLLHAGEIRECANHTSVNRRCFEFITLETRDALDTLFAQEKK